ncbi:GH25 family lysozyme [Actinomadura xylanilytica]|uniref:GH25 family lysozyme n=1 Tax=Actinomadura xylanilytica TaxID=887459 RepID=UPI00255AF1CE|nr:GH25 family lysozyme [Actinomadura xylanilytica]MDL4777067.1 GH25 family lysozyme [Actinomadura xylanilytica]
MLIRSRNVALALSGVTVMTAATALVPGAEAAPGSGTSPRGDLRPGQAYAGVGQSRSPRSQRSRLAGTAKVPAGHLGGMDISSWQGKVGWKAARALGARFAIAKATEGKGYKNPYFQQQYDGSYKAGMVHGAYHFALPAASGGRAQADYFLAHGGRWSTNGRTLPGALDIENNPYGRDACYGLSKKAMVAWIGAFTARYRDRTGRRPLIYTNAYWWRDCTGNDRSLAANPLWMARWRSKSPAPLPGGWKKAAVWQYDDAGRFPGDQNGFRGTWKDLVAFTKKTGAPRASDR